MSTTLGVGPRPSGLRRRNLPPDGRATEATVPEPSVDALLRQAFVLSPADRTSLAADGFLGQRPPTAEEDGLDHVATPAPRQAAA